MASQNYIRSTGDHCVHVRHFSESNFMIPLLRANDMLIDGQNIDMIHKFKVDLCKSFDMKDLVHAKHILGMQIIHNWECEKFWLS